MDTPDIESTKEITNENIINVLERIHPVKHKFETLPDTLCLSKDLGFDSLDILESTVMLDDTFGVETPIDASVPTTLGELREFIQGLRNGKA